jgi:hypothetical protein
MRYKLPDVLLCAFKFPRLVNLERRGATLREDNWITKRVPHETIPLGVDPGLHVMN